MKDYSATLTDGRKIYIPSWPVNVALENLTQAGKCLGSDHLINISYLNIPSVILALMECEDHILTSALVRHFICQARVDGSKISTDTIDEMFQGDLHGVAELFAHVVHSQYADFFELGLAKESSPEE